MGGGDAASGRGVAHVGVALCALHPDEQCGVDFLQNTQNQPYSFCLIILQGGGGGVCEAFFWERGTGIPQSGIQEVQYGLANM